MIKNPAILEHFKNQAKACANMNSPFTAKLCLQLIDLLDETTQTGSRINSWPSDAAADALALRLCGALHAVIIQNPDDELSAIYRDGEHPHYSQILASAINTHDEELVRWLDLPPQTNETGRAAALLPGLLEIARQCKLPLQLCEIGSSAGLNLQLDQFHYAYDNTQWGDLGSPVKLNPVMKANLPDLTGELNIATRTGCDISPLNIHEPGDRLRLRAYVWPDQPLRAERLEGAISLALKNPPELKKQDAALFVEQQLENRPPDTAFVLMHSVVWQYLPKPTQNRIIASLQNHAISANHPIYWLRLEGFGGKDPGARLMLDSWPDHKQVILANSCFHGSWIGFD